MRNFADSPIVSAMPLDWLQTRLGEIGKNRSDLARALGVDPAAITRLFKGERQVQSHEIRKLATFLQMPLEEVAGLVGGPAPAPAGENGTATVNVRILAEVIGRVEEWSQKSGLELQPHDKAEAVALLYPFFTTHPDDPVMLAPAHENVLRLIIGGRH